MEQTFENVSQVLCVSFYGYALYEDMWEPMNHLLHSYVVQLFSTKNVETTVAADLREGDAKMKL